MTQRRPWRASGRLATLAAALLATAAAPTPSRGQAQPPGGGPPPSRPADPEREAEVLRPRLGRPPVPNLWRGRDPHPQGPLRGGRLPLRPLPAGRRQDLSDLSQQRPARQPDQGQAGSMQVPAADDAFRWVIGPPFGHEVVKVIASKKPVDALSLPRLKDDHFNPVTQEHVERGRQTAREGAAQRLVGARPGNPDGEEEGKPAHPPEDPQAVRRVLRGLEVRV